MKTFDPARIAAVSDEYEIEVLPEADPKLLSKGIATMQMYLRDSDVRDLAAAASTSGEYAHIRMEAAIAYITNPECSTVAKLSRHPNFKGRVSYGALQDWCLNDRWEEYRKQFFTSWLVEVARMSGNELLDAKREELRQLRAVRDLAMAKLEDPAVLPKSWEGVAKAMIELSKRTDAVVESVRDELVKQADLKKQVTGGDEEDEKAIGDEELEELLSATLKTQRLQLRETHGVDTTSRAEADTGRISEDTFADDSYRETLTELNKVLANVPDLGPPMPGAEDEDPLEEETP